MNHDRKARKSQEKPGKAKTIIKQDFNRLYIHIPAKRSWLAIFFLSAWLCGWLMGEMFAIRSIFSLNKDLLFSTFLLAWLTLWTYGGFMAILSLLWMLSGKEMISVEGPILTIRQDIFGLGREKQYEIPSIKNMHVLAQMANETWGESNNSYINNGGVIGFDYGMKTINFAGGIEAAEGRMIIKKLQENSNFNEENFA